MQAIEDTFSTNYWASFKRETVLANPCLENISKYSMLFLGGFYGASEVILLLNKIHCNLNPLDALKSHLEQC